VAMPLTRASRALPPEFINGPVVTTRSVTNNYSLSHGRSHGCAGCTFPAITVLAVVGVLFGLYLITGFYTVQPIGALPLGGTVVVWRAQGEPFFNSADALCLKIQGGVSLLCRGLAFQRAPVDRIIMRLRYQRWAYLLSTEGQEFER
jgi:hypothetical protein